MDATAFKTLMSGWSHAVHHAPTCQNFMEEWGRLKRDLLENDDEPGYP